MSAALSVESLCKRYAPTGPWLLDEVSLRIEPGEVLGLVGRSGCGKSTLARCIAGLETPDAGIVRLGAHPLLARRPRDARRHIQYVWQEAQLSLSPYLSALDAVSEPLEGYALVPKAERRDCAAGLLAQMGLTDPMMRRRPDGLSGGQCQRVALARALAAEPDVLLLDEPFAALDIVVTVALIETLQLWLARRPLAVLFVSHDLDAVHRLCQRVVRLEQGRLAPA